MKNFEITKSEADELRQRIAAASDSVFLLIGGHHFPQEMLNNAQNAVRTIDSCAKSWWVWEGLSGAMPHTMGPHTTGPLLIELTEVGGQASPLLDHFFDDWSAKKFGIILQTEFNQKELTEHLQSIAWATGERTGEQFKLNLQVPDKLFPLFYSFTPEDLQSFIGPIKQLSWLQFSGDIQQWLTITNPSPEFSSRAGGWFKLTEEHQRRYRDQDIDFLLSTIASEISTLQQCEQSEAMTIARAAYRKVDLQRFTERNSIALAIRVFGLIDSPDEQEKLLQLLSRSDVPEQIRQEKVQAQLPQAGLSQ